MLTRRQRSLGRYWLYVQFSIESIKILNAFRSSALRESVTQHLYGASKKDHINYSNILSIDSLQNSNDCEISQSHQNGIILPSFEEMISYVYEMNKKRLANSSAQRYTYGRVILAYPYEIFTEVDQPFSL